MAEHLTKASGGLDSPLYSLVFSGAYEQVIRLAAAAYSDLDAPAVIGALALGGRLEEAESVFDARFRGAATHVPASARFFLAAGHCHAGNSERAWRFVRENLGALRGELALERYWAFQGLALVRHFEGRLARARRAARRALAAAIEAGFPYGRFLSLDLLAHVAVHIGEIHAGMRSLAQAADLADALGYAENAATERASQLLFQLRFSVGLGSDALAAVKQLVDADGVSYFTRRNGLLEMSSAHALRGEGTLAARALEEVRRIALPGSDRRATVRWLIGHALCMALSQSAVRARESLAEARREARDELTLRAEVGFVEALFCGPLADGACAELGRVARETSSERARVAWIVATAAPTPFAPRIEDGLCRLLLECLPLPPTERLRRLGDAHCWGLTPWALGLQPGRRAIVLGTLVLTENHGDVSAAELKNRPALRLLLSLSRGYRSRAELLHEVWSINHFSPVRHTPTLHTAISRLRLALGVADWVVTHEDGYSLAAGVEVLSLSDATSAESLAEPLLEHASLPAPPDERTRVLDYVAGHGPLSNAEVARALELSASTALRALRALCAEGLLEKQGGGRSTRYRRVV